MSDSTARAEIDSLLQWWRDAGVDTMLAEEPHVWLQPTGEDGAAAPATRRDTPPPPPAPLAEVALPDEYAAFRTWLASDMTTLSAFPPRRRVSPRGATRASLMIVADVPEIADVEAGRLFSGEVGALLDRMLAALKVATEEVYLTTVAPGRPADGRIDEATERALTPVIQRHIALVGPKKLWLLGRAASRAVLGMDEVAAANRLHCVNQEGITMDVIATAHPLMLIREEKRGGEKPLRKATWRAMQLLNGTLTE